MDLFLTIAGIILLVVGIVGCVLPIIPGPIIGYFSLLVLQFKSNPPFTLRFMVIFALVTICVTILDYIIPVYGTKKFGGTKKGIWGATIGLILGLFFFPPVGIIIGPFLGAFLGELIGGKDTKFAFKSGLGSFLGFISGVFMKLALCFVMGYYFVLNVFFS